jgi:hypothetical protein
MRQGSGFPKDQRTEHIQGAYMPPDHGLPEIKKGKRLDLNTKERADFAFMVVTAYRQGASIRDIVGETGRSYGAIHRIISETPGLRMRSRDGNQRRKR